MKPSEVSYQIALRDFHHARKQAAMQQMLARLRGERNELLPFERVRQQLHATGVTIPHGVQEIPLNKIVGSVDRYEDFTRTFLPKRDSGERRWAGVRAAVNDMVGMPPIDVYQIGDAYFVQDGNHRVSIARRLNTKTISARVTEIETRVPLAADDDPNEIICKSDYADFLEQTNLDQSRPDADLLMTYSGQYQRFIDQIQAQQALKAGTEERQLSWVQAVTDWYDHCYLPVIRIIRELGVLHRFPERTEADIYLLLSERRAELEAELGWRIELETGVSDLITGEQSPANLIDRVVKSIAPATAGYGPPPGIWRQQQLVRQRHHHLFEHLLVPLDGTEEGWWMFDFIVQAAMLDEDHILGLHVVPRRAEMNSPAVRQMKARFETICAAAGVQGEFAVEVSESPVDVIIKRAAWVDCVVVNKSRPAAEPRLSPELKRMVQRCPRPILVRPTGASAEYNRAILAYDGSPKADEALFVAAYITGRWLDSLTVVTVETSLTSGAVLDRARQYLERQGLTNVTYLLRSGPAAKTVLETAQAHRCNLLFMGGFGFRALKQMRLGSSAERILIGFPHPMWICR